MTFLNVSLSTTPLILSSPIIKVGTPVMFASLLAYSSACILVGLYFLETKAALNSTSSNPTALASYVNTSIAPIF